jgi:AraC-like DNA-binding protein
MRSQHAPPNWEIDSDTGTDFGAGAPGFDLFRQTVSDVCDLSAPLGEEGFRATARGRNVGPLILTEVQTSSLRYGRSVRQVAHSGLDYYQINVNLTGCTHMQSARHSATYGPGDIGFLDMIRASDVEVRAPPDGLAHCIAIFVPRKLLTPLLAAPDAEHCASLSGRVKATRLLTETVISMATGSPERSAALIRTKTEALVGLLADGLGSKQEATLPLRKSMRSMALASVKRFIEQNLDSALLDVATVSHRFGLSRATVYRLFDTDGGLVSYVQRRRLLRAFDALVMGRGARRRILDIAVDCHFASDATFNRAFRREFGITPGELRAHANPRVARAGRWPHHPENSASDASESDT